MKTKKIIFGMLLAVTVGFASCKKEEDEQMIPPGLAFKTGGTYVSADVTLPQNDTVMIGINATKSEAEDVLTHLTVTRTYDGTTSTTINDVGGLTVDNINWDHQIITRSVAGTEKYTVTVTNRDGLTTTKSVTITTP